MKKNSLIAFSVVAFSVLAAGACATEHPAYIKFGVGASMINGTTNAYGFQANTPRMPNPFVSTNLVGSKSQTNYGTNAEIAIGHSFFHPNIRTELSYMRLMDQDDAFDMMQLKRKSDTTTINIYYDFINQSKFTPYIGLLLGYGTTQYAFNGLNTNNLNWETSGLIFNAFDTAPPITNPVIDTDAMTYQTTKNTNRSFVGGVKLGVAYKINNNMTFEVDYSIRNLAKAETVIPTNATYAATTTTTATPGTQLFASSAATISSNSNSAPQPLYAGQQNNSGVLSSIDTPNAGDPLPNIQSIPVITSISVALTPFTVPETEFGTPVAATFKSPRYLNSINMGIRLTF